MIHKERFHATFLKLLQSKDCFAKLMNSSQHVYLVIQSDLFGMVKWSFQGVKWTSGCLKSFSCRPWIWICLSWSVYCLQIMPTMNLFCPSISNCFAYVRSFLSQWFLCSYTLSVTLHSRSCWSESKRIYWWLHIMEYLIQNPRGFFLRN